ncbi:MAG: hydantoinase/oxoprolinase family protein [Desulfamplus sp.]|nr:hydantoinase/oxoprolinase family protein [Desulfamplus sp.]
MIIGLDVGGTHADAVLLSEQGVVKNIKVPTDASNLFNTVLTCFNLLLDSTDISKVKRVVISTTLTTNSVVQRNLDTVGIIVSAGPGIDPMNFKRGEHYYPVSGSIDHRGREVQPIDAGEIAAICEEMKQAGIRYVGVIGKFSPRNPAHELKIKSLINDDFDPVFLGHRVSGNLNFPRRISTVFLNTSVYSLHRNFFNAVSDTLKQKGLTIPIQILKADGGTMNLATSMEFPGQTVLSGPAASVMGAIPHAPTDMDSLVLDIGGTTTDIAILVNGAPLLEPVGIGRGKYKSLIRALQTISKGIGGDSEVTVKNKKLKIGPHRRGPAMAFGGPSPTPTDAMIYLGKMEDGERVLAEKAIAMTASKLEVPNLEAAQMIFHETCARIVEMTRKMVDQINSKPVYTVHEFLEGYQINPRKILLLGGPASFMAEKIQELSGIETIALPMSSVANAIGAALARTTCEISLMADTEQGMVYIPEENYSEKISPKYQKSDALETARIFLERKAIMSGASQENLETELIEFQEFNIVRRFSMHGKIFRIKMQVKPGLIKDFSLAAIL